MTRNRRLEKLEQQAQVETATGCALYDSEGNEVQAEIITMPEHEIEGLAELPDGKQLPVVYDAYAIKLSFPEEPSLDESKLYYRRRPGAESFYKPENIRLYLPEDFDVDNII